MTGTCQFCGCTEQQACEGGCGWADVAQTLCTRCELALQFARATLPVMAALAAKPPKDVTDWTQLPADHQLALVAAFRQLSEGVRNHMLASVGDEVATAVVDLAALAHVLYEKFPDEMQKADADGLPVAAVAIELLDRVSQSRIVLPS